MAGPIHQPDSPCFVRDDLLFGLLLITILIPGGYKGVQL